MPSSRSFRPSPVAPRERSITSATAEARAASAPIEGSPGRFDRAPAASAAAGRDVALDLVRGLAVVILVVNHIHLDSALEYATEPFLSAAEALVLVSGVVCGIVFRRRWQADGARAATVALLRRSGRLYVASVVVVAIVGALRFVPGLRTDALTVLPRVGTDLYAVSGPVETLVGILTLAVGPWQFDVLGFFIAALAVAPGVLWALERGWWPIVLTASAGLYLTGRLTMLEVLPSMSERPFPLLIWQVLFVPAMVLGWHRDRLEPMLRAAGHRLTATVAVVALAAAYVRLHEIGLDPLGLDRVLGYGPAEWAAWDREHFDKRSLDPARLVTMVAFTAAAYLVFARLERFAQPTIGRLLIPLGRSSFYVFIMQVFVSLAVASVPMLAGDGLGLVGNTVVQAACVALLWIMVRRRVLFRVVPR